MSCLRCVIIGGVWIGAALLAGSPAEGQTITSYNPTSVSAGGEVAVLGEGFGSRTSRHSIKYGRGARDLGNAEILSWDATWGGNRVRVGLPASIAAGTYWLALYEGWSQLARGPETLTVSGTTKPGPTDPETKDPPIGWTSPPAVARHTDVKISPELSIVSVERIGSGPIRFGDPIPVDVRVRNSGRASTEVAVGYAGSRLFSAPGYHSPPEEIAGSDEETFRLILIIAPQLTREGTFRTSVALLDPRTLGFYSADGNRLDNAQEVSFEIGVPEFYDLTVTWTQLEVHDDSDPHGSGEWTGYLSVCSPSRDCSGVRWPGGVAGVSPFANHDWRTQGPEMTVSDGRPYHLDASVSLARIPRTDGVEINTGAVDDDGWEAPERMGYHRIRFDPNTWEVWNRPVSLRLDSNTLVEGGLYYSGTVTVLARPSH